MSKQENCIFCKIVAGESPKFEVFEDEQTLAFMDINPASEGHVLVIPKAHWQDLYSMPDEQLGYVTATTKRVATAVQKTFQPDGISLNQANGKGAAQSILHFHFHIVPRWSGDELKMNWELIPGDLDSIGVVAARIRKNLI